MSALHGVAPVLTPALFGSPKPPLPLLQVLPSLPPFPSRQVDATWHGHHHSYQRTCEVFNGRCLGQGADGTANAPVHLVIGGAGWGRVDPLGRRQSTCHPTMC